MAKERDRELDREHRERKHKDRDREYRERDRESSRRDRHHRDDGREYEKPRDRDSDKKERDRDRDSDKKDRDRDRDRDRDVRRDKDREKKDRDREREREKVQEKEKKRDRERKEHEKRDRGGRADEDEEERDRKKVKKEIDDVGIVEKKEFERDEEFEEEQRRADEDMVEKRRRRIQEWQELKRRKEEEDIKKRGGGGEKSAEGANGKAWTLEGEESDEEDGGRGVRAGSAENEDVVEGNELIPGRNADMEELDVKLGDADMEVAEEIDPLDAFMNSTILPEVEKLKERDAEQMDPSPTLTMGGGIRNGHVKDVLGRILPGEDSASDYDTDNENGNHEENDDEFMKRVKKTKAEKLTVVDHSKIPYMTFLKNFYIEVNELKRMSTEEVAAYRKELELKVRGKDVPKPLKNWNQTGLSSKVLEVIKKLGYEKPMPIQTQALPVIMSGRDCIGIAKTGSGKTMAFVLPMLRHIMDQPPLSQGDGPIGLIMAPTRELVKQIYTDIRKFSKVMGLTSVAVYGGSGVAQQISELKRGTEIVVCTPGRMIDILCTSTGKITNMRRVTYLVLDEADRMFDMGFEPQITAIVSQIRPDRQTVLFSATFPRQVEILARKVLDKPVEIQVGGRSVVNKDITQTVEVRPESERFLRLLELLGEWYEKGKILVFVHSQEKCDSLFKDLLKSGYPCLSLHGAKDQTDRESTLSDFKSNVCNVLIATSVAARGLDVKDLELVVNFDVPNHYEDYVHRVGRTGRAGRKGCAVTFISSDEERYAPDLVKALELSEQAIPEDLKKLADGFMAKVKQGSEQAHGSGYGGSGFKFNEEEDEAHKAAKKAQAKEYGLNEDEDKSDSESEGEGIRKAGGDLSAQAAAAFAAAAAAGNKLPGVTNAATNIAGQIPQFQAAIAMAQAAAAAAAKGFPPQSAVPGPLGVPGIGLMPNIANMPSGAPMVPIPQPASSNVNDAALKAATLAAAMNFQHNLAKIQAETIPEHYEAELEINDFPQHARWKVTHKDALGQISDWTGAAITTRGQYFPPGKVPAPGERKLFLFIEGPTEASVKKAKNQIKKVLEESTSSAISLPGGTQPGKYSVL